jgi:hypothetical protein
MQTKGINLFYAYQFNKQLDLNRIQTNDNYSVLQIYGVISVFIEIIRLKLPEKI